MIGDITLYDLFLEIKVILGVSKCKQEAGQ